MPGRTDRNGVRPDISARKVTLPPLASLQEPLFVIPDRKDPPRDGKAPRPRQRPSEGRKI